MKLKTLLLGSAAAMIAVTGARAADAVIVEPEPVEYVRVCDLYGSGFYYIPGTETCLKFDGYVRVDYTYGADRIDADLDGDGDSSFSRWDYRARFNVDARNETDYGTLRSQIRFQGDGNGGGDAVVGIDRALISLGGLRFGYSDSFQTTHHGYGLPVEKYDGYYAYDQAIFLDYTFAVAGFSVTAGIQESVGGGATVADPHTDLEYYIGTGYSNDLFNVALSYLYEESADNGIVKVSAGVTPFDGFSVSGFYLTSELGDNDSITRTLGGVAATATTAQQTNDWAWGVGASYQFIDTMAIRAGYTDADLAADYFVVGLNWTPVSGLAVRPEVQIFADDDFGQEYSLRVYRTF